MNNAINIDTYLNRQREIFEAYTNSSGKKSAIMPFVSKYSVEDNREYTLDDILKYIKSYMNSNLSNEKDLNKFNGTKKVSNKVIFARGKLIVQRLIESKGDLDSVKDLNIKFALEDDRTKPYPKKYIDTCIDYYISHTKNQERAKKYNIVMSLSSRSDNYDIELINTLINLKDVNKAIDFVKEINISKTSMISLRQEYKLLYPANKKELNTINQIIDKAFIMDKKVIKFIDSRSSIKTNSDKIKIVKRMMEEYILSDIEDISILYPKYGFNDYKFKETLKDAKTSRDIILNNLISQYYAKKFSVYESKKEIIDKIINYINNGINYGNGYREFNSFDLKNILKDESLTSLLNYAKHIYNADDFEKIYLSLSSFDFDDKNYTKDDLIKKINSLSSAEINISDDDINLIIEYLEYAKLPYTYEMFMDVKERYLNNDISLDCEEKRHVA